MSSKLKKNFTLRMSSLFYFREKFQMNRIQDLPGEFLCNLAKSYLSREDLVNLCDSSPYFDFLRLYLPEILELKGESFTVKGPSYSNEHRVYLLSPVINHQRVRRITMSYRWKQGWGNSKGMLWMDVVRNGVTIASSYKDFFDCAPQEWETEDVVISSHVVDKIRKGDVLQFMRYVGWGLGRRGALSVEDFSAKIELLNF